MILSDFDILLRHIVMTYSKTIEWICSTVTHSLHLDKLSDSNWFSLVLVQDVYFKTKPRHSFLF